MTDKIKTSISIDIEVWHSWVKFVVNKTGSVKTVGKETELALKEYMKRHTKEPVQNEPS
jgi:hypothetical protein